MSAKGNESKLNRDNTAENQAGISECDPVLIKGIKPVLYGSDAFQKIYNTEYPLACTVNCLADLERVAQHDNISAKCKKNHRGKDDYISDNMIIMDCDNTHSEDEEDWYTPDHVAEAFPEVAFYVIYSRNHNKPKKKDNTTYAPRPKFHLYFPCKNASKDYESAACIRAKVLCYFPAFDTKCGDPVHMMYGVKNAHGEVYAGKMCIDEFISNVDKEAPDTYGRNLTEFYASFCSDLDSEEKKPIEALFKCDFVNASIPGQEPEADTEAENADDKEAWLEGFLRKHDVKYTKTRSGNTIQYKVLCPWHESHTSGDDIATVSIQNNGKYGFKCHHHHCNNRHWADFRAFYDPASNWKRFHIINENTGKVTGLIDDAIAEDVIDSQDMFNYQGMIFLYDHGVYIRDETKAVVKEMISQRILQSFRKYNSISQIHNLMLTKTRIIKGEKDLNLFPKSWISFSNGMLDVDALRLNDHDPKYCALNQIPHPWIDKEPATDSIVVEYLNDLIKEPDDLEMFLQFCGYCMTHDTSQQLFLVIHGNGGTGKSVLLRMLTTAIGAENVCNISLQDINASRWGTYFLMGKLVNIYADLPSKDMSEIDKLKTITGEDAVSAEIKGGAIFSYHPYCKLMFSANKIPKSRDDKTEAYYRRMRILTINKRAREIPDLEAKLTADIQSFIWLCVQALRRMYQNGGIIESYNSKQEVAQLYADTDSVQAFLSDCGYVVTGDSRDRLNRKDLFCAYEIYCNNEGITRGGGMYTKRGFYSNLKDKGCIVDDNTRTQGGENARAIAGIKWKPDG